MEHESCTRPSAAGRRLPDGHRDAGARRGPFSRRSGPPPEPCGGAERSPGERRDPGHGNRRGGGTRIVVSRPSISSASRRRTTRRCAAPADIVSKRRRIAGAVSAAPAGCGAAQSSPYSSAPIEMKSEIRPAETPPPPMPPMPSSPDFSPHSPKRRPLRSHERDDADRSGVAVELPRVDQRAGGEGIERFAGVSPPSRVLLSRVRLLLGILPGILRFRLSGFRGLVLRTPDLRALPAVNQRAVGEGIELVPRVRLLFLRIRLSLRTLELLGPDLLRPPRSPEACRPGASSPRSLSAPRPLRLLCAATGVGCAAPGVGCVAAASFRASSTALFQ